VRVLLEREEVAPTSQIIMAERRSRIPLGMVVRGW